MLSTLILMILAPLFGAALIAFFQSNHAYILGIYTSILTFFISIFLLIGFDPNFQGFQFYISYFYPFLLGIDGLSLFFILLTTFIFPLCILSSTSAIHFNHKLFIFFFIL